MCDRCDDGLILKDNTRHFCECPAGKRRRDMWMKAGERVIAEAEKDRRKRAYKDMPKAYSADYKAEAAGNHQREPGEEG